MQELQLRLASEKVLFNNPVLISYVSPNDETPSYEDTVTDIGATWGIAHLLPYTIDLVIE